MLSGGVNIRRGADRGGRRVGVDGASGVAGRLAPAKRIRISINSAKEKPAEYREKEKDI